MRGILWKWQMHFPAKSHNNNGESANNLWSASLAWPSQVRRMPGCQDARMQVVNVFATSLLMFIIHPICNPFGYISPENCITLSLKLILRFHLSKKDVGQDEEKHQKKRGKTVSDEKHVLGLGPNQICQPRQKNRKNGVIYIFILNKLYFWKSLQVIQFFC